MKLIIILSILITTNAFALISPFESSIGLTIPNSHEVYPNLYRGNAPRNPDEIRQLVELGITDILIFKKQSRDELDKEKVWLSEAGYKPENIYHIEFLWRDFKSHAQACKMAIEGLQILDNLEKAGKKVFFHCTVGEDRTGLLAGLYELSKRSLGIKEAFKNQMCENGYSAGNPQKPKIVVDGIRAWLSPVYLKLAAKLQKKSISELKGSDCRFKKSEKVITSEFYCKKSSKFPKN